jgi:hypothetical protein
MVGKATLSDSCANLMINGQTQPRAAAAVAQPSLCTACSACTAYRMPSCLANQRGAGVSCRVSYDAHDLGALRASGAQGRCWKKPQSEPSLAPAE